MKRCIVIIRYLLLIILVYILITYITKQVIEHNKDSSDPMLKKIKHDLLHLDPIVSSLVFHGGEKSYTINKKHIYICLKNEYDEYYDYYTLLYVTIHEIAHTLCDSVGHTEEFHRTFHTLLNKAKQLGIYNDSIHKPIENYCNYN